MVYYLSHIFGIVCFNVIASTLFLFPHSSSPYIYVFLYSPSPFSTIDVTRVVFFVRTIQLHGVICLGRDIFVNIAMLLLNVCVCVMTLHPPTQSLSLFQNLTLMNCNKRSVSSIFTYY